MTERSAHPFPKGLGAVLLAISVFGLAACSAQLSASTIAKGTSAHEATPGASAGSSTPAPAFTPDPYWVTGNGGVYPQGQSAEDRGAIRHAEGTVTPNASGQPISYTAVRGDTLTAIAQRFEMQLENLDNLNCIRRDPLDQRVYVGDILNLDPHTAVSVGSQHGATFAPTSQQRATCLAFLPPQH